jgi:putative MATE family efflux protein
MQLQVTYKEIWRLAYPIIISSFAQSMLNIIDTIFLGRVGEVELGASVIAGIWYISLVVVAWAISSGTQIIMSRRIGEQKENETGIVFDNSLYLLFIFSIICFVVLRFGAHPVFAWTISSPKILAAALQFSDTRSFGIFFVMLSMSFRAFTISIARTRIITYSMLMMAGINIILAYTFIFGKFGAPAMGIRGAALASVIAEASALIFFITHILTRIDLKRYNLFRFAKPHIETIKKILTIGYPVGLQYLVSMGGWFLFFVFIEKIGQHQLAISNIVRSAYMLGMTPIWGLSAAASTITSNIIGQGRHDDVFVAMKNICSMSFIIIAAASLINFLIPGVILNIFTSDPALIRDAYGCMRIMNVAMLFFSVGFILITMVSGTGATRVSLMIESFAIFIYVLYIYVVVEVMKMRVESVWVSEVIYWMLMAALSYRYLKSMKWKSIKV